MNKRLLTDKEIDNTTPTKEEVLKFKDELTPDKVEGWATMTEKERLLTAFSILASKRTSIAQDVKTRERRDAQWVQFYMKEKGMMLEMPPDNYKPGE